jgi:hypothetical protein
LVLEQCHPFMFELELENPELLPIDWILSLYYETSSKKT